MKKLLCIALLWLNAACASQQSQVEQKIGQELKQELELVAPEKFATHALLIFLDDSEDAIDAISGDTINALHQQAAPVLVSKYLINNILMRSDRLGINPQEWVIKDLARGSLLLFIPKSYKPSNMQTAPLQNYQPTKPATLSDAELAIGLKIDHMESLNLKNMQELETEVSSLVIQDNRDYFMHALWDVAKKTSEIFVTKSEYINARKASGPLKNPMPQWVITIDGHGEIGTLIANLKPQQFKDFTTFLDTNIFCKLLFYSTCFAAGTNTDLVYKDLTTKETRYNINSFVVVFEGFVPATTRGKSPKYNQFIINVTTTDVISSWPTTVAPLIASGLQESNDKVYVKLPDQHWFTLQSIDDNLLSIGSVMAKSRTQPLSLKTFKKNIIRFVALYAPVVNFELIIDTPVMPSVKSMIPGSAIHVLQKIKGDDLVPLLNMMQGALRVPNPENKIFFIKEVEALKEPLTLPDGQKAFKINDVIIELVKDLLYQNDGYRVFFEYKAQQYKITIYHGGKVEIINYPYKKEYQDILDYAVEAHIEKSVEQRAPFQHLENIQQKKIKEIKKMPKLKKQSAAINNQIDTNKVLIEKKLHNKGQLKQV